MLDIEIEEEEEESFSDRFVWDLQGIKRLGEWASSREEELLDSRYEMFLWQIAGLVKEYGREWENILLMIDEVEQRRRTKDG